MLKDNGMGQIIDLDQQQRAPGRIRTPARRPSQQRKARTERYNAALEVFTRLEPVVRAAHEADSVEVLYAARHSVAQEAASLLWQRMQEVPASREAARISSRRIAALAEVGSLTIAINKANPGQPSPERVERVLGALRAEVVQVVRDLYDNATAERFLDELGRRLPDAVSSWASR